jgi:hypothetical protein
MCSFKRRSLGPPALLVVAFGGVSGGVVNRGGVIGLKGGGLGIRGETSGVRPDLKGIVTVESIEHSCLPFLCPLTYADSDPQA